MAAISLSPLREHYYLVLICNIHVKRDKMMRENNPVRLTLADTVGAHFLSHNALLPPEKTEALDACASCIIVMD